MKLFRYKQTGEPYHLIYSKGWGAAPGNGIVGLRIQFFCQTQGFPVTGNKWMKKFEVIDYDRELHKKNLCDKCVLKAKQSKKHGPSIN